ncbi:MAG: SDR family oxidoreductase [Acidimicrobiales bacterium]|jgi:NAD(P)-dependent dehydrogenase (short-subunit alcohol dehydrogenase family)
MAGRICEGRVAIVTGAGRGIGRAEALELARQGARVVVNDLGAEVDGTGGSLGPAGEVVDEIRGFGGEAVVNGEDVADWEGAQRLVNTAVETFGRLDVLVNNAGILRDRMLVNMTDEEWDAVIRVHLRGTFAPARWAATYWRELVKAGETVDARIINTTSSSGIYGNPGQANYGAAKAGIAAFTVITAMELARYGVSVNAIAPGALTRMTEGLGAIRAARTGESADLPASPLPSDVARSPENVAPLVAWLASGESAGITGRVFNIGGGRLSVAEGWVAGPGVERQGLFETEELGSIVPGLVAEAAANADMRGRRSGPS